MYVVTVQFDIHPQHVDAFREEMLLQASNSMTHEESCRQFDVCFDHENPAKCFLYEKYEDRAAFDLHLASDHFKRFSEKVASWIASKAVQTWKQEN